MTQTILRWIPHQLLEEKGSGSLTEEAVWSNEQCQRQTCADLESKVLR
jgi:hypothetical protein